MSITYESEPCLISASARVGMAFSHFRGNLMDLDEPTPCYAVSPRGSSSYLDSMVRCQHWCYCLTKAVCLNRQSRSGASWNAKLIADSYYTFLTINTAFLWSRFSANNVSAQSWSVQINASASTSPNLSVSTRPPIGWFRKWTEWDLWKWRYVYDSLIESLIPPGIQLPH